MRRFSHGGNASGSVLSTFSLNLNTFKAMSGATAGIPAAGSDFCYMFEDVQAQPQNRLEPTAATLVALKQLAQGMSDGVENTPGGGVHGPGDSDIPAAYTYFGQFVDHDITFDKFGLGIEALADPNLQPLASLTGIGNARTATLDLDSVYAAPASARNGARFVLGNVTPLNGTSRPALSVPGKSVANDLPRQGRNQDKDLDRAADIGDPRNDENTIVAQLHVAFLKAHNTLVDGGLSFDGARRELILRYQAAVLHDFLGRVTDKAVLNDVVKNGPRHWKPDPAKPITIPVEFAVAAYRFGHSMVRRRYDFNVNFTNEFSATFLQLFSFTALSGQIGLDVAPDGFDTLPDNWIIEWERFLQIGASKPQMARLIDPRLTNELFRLRNTLGEPEGTNFPPSSQPAQLAPHLAMRNLIRGYLFALPTGQAIARKIGATPLDGQAMIDALPTPELKALINPLKDRTPLWFYILAEAADPKGPGGKHLGAVGSRIVVETFWNLIKRSTFSILDGADHGSIAGTTLRDIIELAAKQD